MNGRNMEVSNNCPADQFSSPSPQLNIKCLERVSLGPAWATNTVNTSIFRHHGILTFESHQYTAFYVDCRTIRVVRRCLRSNAVETYDLFGKYNPNDAHNGISLGADSLGFVHISYDHHASPLKYRRSLRPQDILAWTEEIPMTSSKEDRITYPTFISPRGSYPLLFLYRDGVPEKGAVRLKSFNEQDGAWEDYPTAVLSGEDLQPWTCNAYWNNPVVCPAGDLHITFTWRTHSIGERALINNNNICYCKSIGWGKEWTTSQGKEYRLPVTPVNAEVIQAVSPGSNLINQCAMVVDRKGRVHVAYYANDRNEIPQYIYAWLEEGKWQSEVISSRTSSFSLEGKGTLQLPISRPVLFADKEDNVFMLSQGDWSERKLALTVLQSPCHSNLKGHTQILLDMDLGFSEPVIDRERWERENVLTLYLQYSDQPHNDDSEPESHREAFLADFIIDFQG